jgi:hypothetical protein
VTNTLPIEDQECGIHYGVEGGTNNPLYVVMDSKTVNDDLLIMKCGTDVNCDWNGDGIDEVFSGGQRAWLDLDGTHSDYGDACSGEGASELSCWVEKGYGGFLRIHTWLAGNTGVATSLFKDVITYQLGHNVMLPVFDAISGNYPTTIHQSPEDGGTDDMTDVILQAGNVNSDMDYFHVINFATFHITCVEHGGTVAAEGDPKPAPKHCPGKQMFIDNNQAYFDQPSNKALINKLKTIEGYFVQGEIEDFKGACGPADSTTSYTIYLNQ